MYPLLFFLFVGCCRLAPSKRTISARLVVRADWQKGSRCWPLFTVSTILRWCWHCRRQFELRQNVQTHGFGPHKNRVKHISTPTLATLPRLGTEELWAAGLRHRAFLSLLLHLVGGERCRVEALQCRHCANEPKPRPNVAIRNRNTVARRSGWPPGK